MSSITRRRFMGGAAAGIAAAAAPRIVGQVTGGEADPIHLAIIGAGDHGRHLVSHCMKLPGLKFKAVCDIWEFSRMYSSRLLKKYKHPVNTYADYREMLSAEKDLHAVIIATPDGFHAEQTIACLEAGLHVYCEKEMALTRADCRKMVQASKKAGKLLQVGRQHRSNARYVKALELIDKQKALGRMTHVSGQWRGHKRDPLGWPKKYEMDKATLEKYGFGTMDRFRNWRWLKRFAAGEIASLGSHQIDVFNWFLHAVPKSVYAAGGLDYYDDTYELYDNVSCIYEWDYDWGGRTTRVRGNYEVLNTTELGGFFETFTGTEGEIIISEIASRGGIWRDVHAPVAEWEKDFKQIGQAGYGPRQFAPIPSTDTKRVYWHHLKNFFDAVRGKAKLACPGEVGLEAAVAVLRVAESMSSGKRVDFAPEEFRV